MPRDRVQVDSPGPEAEADDTVSADYAKYGAHAFRVGGVVAMQDAGASAVEVMAQGRWRSDAWRVYSRRSKRSSMTWASAIMAVKSRARPDIGRAAPAAVAGRAPAGAGAGRPRFSVGIVPNAARVV